MYQRLFGGSKKIIVNSYIWMFQFLQVGKRITPQGGRVLLLQMSPIHFDV